MIELGLWFRMKYQYEHIHVRLNYELEVLLLTSVWLSDAGMRAITDVDM